MNLYLNEKASVQWRNVILGFFSNQKLTPQVFITKSNYGVDGTVHELYSLIPHKESDPQESHLAIAHTYVLLGSHYCDTIVIVYKNGQETKMVTQTLSSNPSLVDFDIRAALLDIFPL